MKFRTISSAFLAAVLVLAGLGEGAPPAHATGEVFYTPSCGTADDTAGIQTLVNAASTGTTPYSGFDINDPTYDVDGFAQMNVVRLPTSSTCRLQGLVLKSNVQLEVPPTTTIEPVDGASATLTGGPMITGGESGHVHDITIVPPPGSSGQYTVQMNPVVNQTNSTYQHTAAGVKTLELQDVDFVTIAEADIIDHNGFRSTCSSGCTYIPNDPMGERDNRSDGLYCTSTMNPGCGAGVDTGVDQVNTNNYVPTIVLKSAGGDPETYPSIPSDEPHDVTIDFNTLENATFGYGLVQVVGGFGIAILDNTETGGILCRFEDSHLSDWPKNVIDQATCLGNSALDCNALWSTSAHGQDNGAVTIDDNIDTGCYTGGRAADSSDGAGGYGSFADVELHDNTWKKQDGGSNAAQATTTGNDTFKVNQAPYTTKCWFKAADIQSTLWTPHFHTSTFSPSGWTTC
jgi:hypothetical protein